MLTPGQIYFAIVTLLLLVALGVGIPILKGILEEGLERRRKWKSGELEPYTEDEEFDRGPPAALEGETTAAETTEQPCRTCRQCGAENDMAFRYCRRCIAPL